MRGRGGTKQSYIDSTSPSFASSVPTTDDQAALAVIFFWHQVHLVLVLASAD
jgi:hypothetical protein